jgi:surfactin synthase thioesterase subunit
VPRPTSALQLVAFPHAGGGASAYREWAARLPQGVEVLAVQCPGREDRLSDEPADDVDELVGALADDLSRVIDRPYLVFGHSMGAAIAFETIRALRDRGFAEPERLIVSGRRAPDRFLGGEVHRNGEAALKAELQRLGGTPREIFDHPEMADIVLRVLGNDYRLIENHHPRAGEPLACPVTVVLAAEDPELSREHVADWHALAAGGDLVELPGDHFYLVAHRDALLAEIVARVDPALLAHGEVGP